MGPLLDRLEARAASAEGRGWVRLHEVLKAAEGDPAIRAAGPAADFLALMVELVGNALFSASADDALAPLAKALNSAAAADRARSRHEATESARAWVLREWGANAGAYERNKSAFAADYVLRCKRELGVQIRERTIRETWLKGK